jgi:hypothetical protein
VLSDAQVFVARDIDKSLIEKYRKRKQKGRNNPL